MPGSRLVSRSLVVAVILLFVAALRLDQAVQTAYDASWVAPNGVPVRPNDARHDIEAAAAAARAEDQRLRAGSVPHRGAGAPLRLLSKWVLPVD